MTTLLGHLESLDIRAETVEHPPVFTVEENQALRGDLPGAHCKNLFLKDKKGQLWLVVTLEERSIDLKALRSVIGSSHLSFASAEVLREALGIEPGSVTPFAVINDAERRVRVVLDADMMTYETLNYHPLTNTATTAVSPDDLLKFLASTGHTPDIKAL